MDAKKARIQANKINTYSLHLSGSLGLLGNGHYSSFGDWKTEARKHYDEIKEAMVALEKAMEDKEAENG